MHGASCGHYRMPLTHGIVRWEDQRLNQKNEPVRRNKIPCPVFAVFRGPQRQVFVAGVVGREGGKPPTPTVPGFLCQSSATRYNKMTTF